MSQKFPADDFDFDHEVGGRHRARRGAADRLVEFGAVIASGVVLAGGGYFALQTIAAGGQLGADTGLPQSNVAVNQFTKGDGIGVSVIDASKGNDAASVLGQKLLDAGWNVWSASRMVNSVGNPALTKTTTVYASSDSNKSAATSLAKSLGNYPVVVSPTYADPITVVLGVDYK